MFGRPPNPNRSFGLWFLALVFAGLGYGALKLLEQDQTNPDYERHRLLTLLLTVILSGLCVIAATARLWIRR